MLHLRTHTVHFYHGQLKRCHLRYSAQHRSRLWRAFATSTPRLKKSNPSQKLHAEDGTEKPKVRWYQQLLPWSTKRTRADGDLGFVSGEQYDEAKWLKDEIAKDTADLRDMEGRGGRTLVEPLLATLSKEDAQEVRDAIMREDLEDARKEEEADVKEKTLAKLLPTKGELEIQMDLPQEQQPYLASLNHDILRTSADLTNQGLRKKLWRSYTRCKAFLPPFLPLVPQKLWDVLWASQQTATPDDVHWAPHMVTLSEDMVAAGRELNVYQRILYIEALLAEKGQQSAIKQWQELEKHIRGDQKAIEEHELLGVRLFASNGNPEKAERIALNFLGTEKQEESRILIPILHAWAQRGDDIGIQHAWALYLRFRTQVGDNITMDDYDNITMGFLSVGRTDIALAVFKDMMLTGKPPDEGSIELYKRSLAMMGRTQSAAITVEDLNRISLTGLIVLPEKFQNKFFYGSWLKKLLGMGEVDSAAQVIELMYERGVRPDPKHLNGIIGAWLRSGAEKHRESAEKMAWAMIHERVDFVNARRRGEKPQSSKIPMIKGRPMPVHLRRSVAPANIETFSLLLQHYGRRAQDENVQLVRNALEMAEIQPNTYFINHLLYIDLRRGEHQAAWIKYKDMSGAAKPDLETYACLWDCEKAHLESLAKHSADKFPSPRRIMSEMMTWFCSINDRYGGREAVLQEFSKDLYDQILRCMGFASDLEGLIVLLYILRDYFGFYPDLNTYKAVNTQVSRMKMGRPKETPTTGRHNSRNDRKANANNIARVLAIVIHRRELELAKHGLDAVAQFDDDIQREEGLYRLAEFLRTILRRSSAADSIDRNIEEAAWEMGVGGMRMEDPLPSYGARKDMYRLSDRG